MNLLSRLPLLVILAGMGAALMLIPAAYASTLGQHDLASIFSMTTLIAMVLIVATGIASAAAPAGDTTRTMLLTVIGAFTILPAIFAAPLALALPDTGFFNAWWEMVSSLTATGASLYAPDALAEPLHLWRGIVGWMGGLFILVAATAILAPLRIGGFEIMAAPYGGAERQENLPRSEVRRGARVSSPLSSPAFQTDLIDPVNRIFRIGKAVLPIYFGLTLGLWMVLLMLGDPGLEALMRAMGTLSTSGITSQTVGAVQISGVPGEMVIFLFMIPALSRRFWPGGGELRASETWPGDPELRLAGLVVLGVALVIFARHFIGSIEIGKAGEDFVFRLDHAIAASWGGLFNALSYLTTTGWNSVEWQGARSWSGLTSPGLILAGLALMGGGVATAAGGVKLLRVFALVTHAEREMEKLVHPNSVGGGGRMGRRLRTEGAFLAFVFFMLFAISIAAVIVLISLQRIEFESATILAVSALTNTGPLAGAIPLTPTFEGSAGIAGAPWAGWAGLPAFTKSVLAGAMILGRVETLAILALFNPEIWRR